MIHPPRLSRTSLVPCSPNGCMCAASIHGKFKHSRCGCATRFLCVPQKERPTIARGPLLCCNIRSSETELGSELKLKRVVRVAGSPESEKRVRGQGDVGAAVKRVQV